MFTENVPKPRSIVVLGTWLEGAVTLLALEALFEGHDVHIASDLCTTQDPDFRQLYLQRLAVSGATVSTLAQISREFAWPK